MKNVVIFGAGGHGKVIADILERKEEYNLLGFLDGGKEVDSEFFGYGVLGDESYLKDNNVYGCIVAIGDNWIRSVVVEKILIVSPNITFINAIHPSAQIGRCVSLGSGNVVMANSIINSDTEIGNHCIINTKSSIGHDNSVGNYVTFAPGTTVGGNGSFGDFSTISLGANIIHGINIGEHTVIGAGSTVVNNIESYSVAFGTPAKITRKRKENDRYL